MEFVIGMTAIAVALMIWAEAGAKKAASGWVIVDGPEAADAFAGMVLALGERRGSFLGKSGTGIGAVLHRGLLHAAARLPRRRDGERQQRRRHLHARRDVPWDLRAEHRWRRRLGRQCDRRHDGRVARHDPHAVGSDGSARGHRRRHVEITLLGEQPGVVAWLGIAAVITAIVSRKNIRITFFIARLPVCSQS